MRKEKMKNVIYCVIDAFCYDNLLLKNGDKYITPFLNKAAKENISLKNVYSIAPYTEASLVTILGDELCLDNGGYLFGNGTVEKSIISYFKDVGYHTIYEYAPYVFSKAYIKDVDDYYYSRLYSLSPLFTYRLNYYREKGRIEKKELDVCRILLQEGIETWINQCKKILEEDEACKPIKCIAPDAGALDRIYNCLLQELKELDANGHNYVKKVLSLWHEHKLWKLNEEYLMVKEYPCGKYIKDKYSGKIAQYQNKVSTLNRKNKINIQYIISTLLNSIDGKNDTRGLLMAYRRMYRDESLKNVLESINPCEKPEIGINSSFNSAFNYMKKCERQNENYFVYMQPQDFHLPSSFYSFDSGDMEVINREMQKALTFLDELSSEYTANILALLSAHYCDYMLEQFYNKCKKELENDFVFVITADHGYPCFDNPPRPYTYNQTYKEAFHVPFIIIGEGEKTLAFEDKYMSIKDANALLKKELMLETPEIKSNGYVLCEFAGPGCPIIVEKPIWYTYIDSRYCVSVRAMLDKKITRKNITEIYNLENDENEQNNLRRRKVNVNNIIEIINERHMELSGRFNKEEYYDFMLKRIKANEVV